MLQTSRREFLNFGSVVTAAPAEESWLHVNRTAMACRFEVTLPASTQSGVGIATEALNEVDEIERQLSVFKAESAVSLLNREAASRAVPVERSLFELLWLCKELYDETEGAFDITSGPLTRCWGFLKREGRIPSDVEIARARVVVGSDKLVLDRKARSVGFKLAGTEINLGSIGKGYALDVVKPRFDEKRERALLSAGASSFLAIGDREWLVGVRHPRAKDRRLATVRLRGCAMSTSGSEEQFFECEGRRFGHIIDPRSGWPASEVTSVTVIANSAARSDALATAFFVGGRAFAERYCEKHADVLAIVLEGEQPVLIGRNARCVVELL